MHTKDSEKKAQKLKYFISKKVGKAIAGYKMFQDGDKILVVKKNIFNSIKRIKKDYLL